nr:hypothetical protein GCM10020185_42560 [Pseudomonas brassicacearum subsp. brassicacearum]
MLGSLAAHYKFSLDMPFNELPADQQKFILQGSGSQNVDFKYLNDRGDIVKRSHPFEGIVPNLERRYRETESASVREELAKFLSTQPCPDCRGTRLRREARHVWVGEKNAAGGDQPADWRRHRLFRRFEAHRPSGRNR